MKPIDYFKIGYDRNIIFLTKNPTTWFLCDSSKQDEIERLLSSGSGEMADYLSQHAKSDIRPEPRHLALHPVMKITNRCNLNCSHCYIESHKSMKEGKLDLDIRAQVRFVDYVLQLGNDLGMPTLTMQLFGGEPTLHGDFTTIVEYIRSQNLYTRVSTNAANVKLFQSGKFDPLFADKDIEWRVSLESHIPEKHNVIRPNSFHKVTDNIRYMADKGANISIKTVVADHNFRELEETIHFAKSLGARDYLYSPMSFTGAARKNGLSTHVTSLMINKMVIDIIERDPNIGRFLRTSPLARYLRRIYAKTYNIAPRVQFFINHDGKVCPQDNLFENAAYHFGGVYHEDFGFETLQYYQQTLESDLGVCKGCPVEAYCPKGDYADLVANSPVLGREFTVCGDIRNVIFHLMSLGKDGIRVMNHIYGGPNGFAEVLNSSVQ